MALKKFCLRSFPGAITELNINIYKHVRNVKSKKMYRGKLHTEIRRLIQTICAETDIDMVALWCWTLFSAHSSSHNTLQYLSLSLSLSLFLSLSLSIYLWCVCVCVCVCVVELQISLRSVCWTHLIKQFMMLRKSYKHTSC